MEIGILVLRVLDLVLASGANYLFKIYLTKAAGTVETTTFNAASSAKQNRDREGAGRFVVDKTEVPTKKVHPLHRRLIAFGF
jgi:hypothetical protein